MLYVYGHKRAEKDGNGDMKKVSIVVSVGFEVFAHSQLGYALLLQQLANQPSSMLNVTRLHNRNEIAEMLTKPYGDEIHSAHNHKELALLRRRLLIDFCVAVFRANCYCFSQSSTKVATTRVKGKIVN